MLEQLKCFKQILYALQLHFLPNIYFVGDYKLTTQASIQILSCENFLF